MIFPPAFLDSPSWNDHQQQHAHQEITAGGGDHELAVAVQQGGLGEGGGGGGGQVGPAKPMSMSERARLARVPLPELGLKCPRCDSGNTKFCYFNNYSLSQPRHFCRACRRYWTRGGALRNVPVGGGYRRHAKRAKAPKQSAAGGASSTATTTSGCTATAAVLPGSMLSGNLSGLLPPLLRLSDFDAMSLGSTFSGMGKPPCSVDTTAGIYGGAGLDHWRLQQMQGFPFFHAMDHQASAALAPPPAMTATPGMFYYLGVDGDGRGGAIAVNDNHAGEEAAADHLRCGGTPLKREGYYPPRGSTYGDHHHTINGYASYPTTAAAAAATGNHLL